MTRKSGGEYNAITHGAYTDVLLPHEGMEEFELLHQGLIEEWKPARTLEEHTVLTLAQCIWQKRRADWFYDWEAMWAQEHPEYEVIEKVERFARLLGGVTTVEKVTEVISQLPEHYKEWIQLKAPRSKFNDEKTWIQSVQTEIWKHYDLHQSIVILQEAGLRFRAETATRLRELTEKNLLWMRDLMLASTRRSRDLLN